MLQKLRQATKLTWPPIDYELSEARDKGYLRGHVLNAGAGVRDISHLVAGTLVNQDLRWDGDNRQNIQIFSSIDNIPRPDGVFDAVVCIAVLEHVQHPNAAVREMYRVLRAGGRLIASVPFMQPEHKVPTDYQRYTRDGLVQLLEDAGFIVEECRPLFNVYFTLHWIISDWLALHDGLFFKSLRVILLPPLVILARASTLQSDRLASAFQIIGRKPDGTAMTGGRT